VRDGSVTPREEGFAKQTQVMLLGGWYAKDVIQEPGAGRGSQEPCVAQALLVKKVPQIYIAFSYSASLTNVHF
jgi:hypothetical protein